MAGFDNLLTYLARDPFAELEPFLHSAGQKGVNALEQATPKDTGLTAASWSYKVEKRRGGLELSWWNNNTNDGVPIATVLYYGAVNRDGSFREGYDYITPALDPILQEIADYITKVVRQA
jgi:uncharacterized protein with gpF-like domain